MRLVVAALAAATILFVGPAVAQEPDLGRVATPIVCTERGAVALLQALTKSFEAAEEIRNSDQCRSFPRAVTLRIVGLSVGPVDDFEGDEMYVAEVQASRPVPHRFTIAWPGFNAELTGQDS